MMTQGPEYIRGSRIAEILGVDKKTVHNRALREAWPMTQESNRWVYLPPSDVASLCAPVEDRGLKMEDGGDALPLIKFTELPADSNGRKTALRREEAVKLSNQWVMMGKGQARRQVVAMLITKYSDFNISPRSLERWEADYAAHGIDGLVEQKLGRVGRKATEVPAEFANIGKALVLGHGSAARAARELMSHPELPASMRVVLHEGHASKSYVNPTIRAAITPAPLTVALAQGPRAARLSDRFTPGNYDDVKAGDVYVSDDMTSNVYCWVEWPNQNGWKIGQAQILPVLDVGSLRWLTVRVIVRDSGQYTSDDAAGTFGDTFDQFGLPRQGVVLEGGIWQGNKVIGHRTNIGDDERVGGFASLGLQVFRSYDPRSKIIETCFNQLQYAMDNLPGYAGRDQRHDITEAFKKKIALLKAKHPVHHPREFLPHVSQLATHVQQVMANLNNERNDGVILRGRCPAEKWMEESGGMAAIPDSAKWLYRSAMSICDVKKNGIKVTQRSGKNTQVYWYDNPALLTARMGMKVVVYWNDRNPDADICVMSGTGKSRQFLGMASRVQPLGRFSATTEELGSEAARKREAMNYSRTELRTIQGELARKASPLALDGACREIGANIAGAADRADKADAEKTDLKRIERKFKQRALTVAEETEPAEILSDRGTAPHVPITDEELNEL